MSQTTLAILSIIFTAILGPLIVHYLTNKADKNLVCYRDTIRLTHANTGFYLHSHTNRYSHRNSSQQQQVTAFNGSDRNDNWRIKEPHGENEFFREGQAVKNGDIIRLEHCRTGRNLQQ